MMTHKLSDSSALLATVDFYPHSTDIWWTEMECTWTERGSISKVAVRILCVHQRL